MMQKIIFFISLFVYYCTVLVGALFYSFVSGSSNFIESFANLQFIIMIGGLSLFALLAMWFIWSTYDAFGKNTLIVKTLIVLIFYSVPFVMVYILKNFY